MNDFIKLTDKNFIPKPDEISLEKLDLCTTCNERRIVRHPWHLEDNAFGIPQEPLRMISESGRHLVLVQGATVRIPGYHHLYTWARRLQLPRCGQLVLLEVRKVRRDGRKLPPDAGDPEPAFCRVFGGRVGGAIVTDEVGDHRAIRLVGAHGRW